MFSVLGLCYVVVFSFFFLLLSLVEVRQPYESVRLAMLVFYLLETILVSSSSVCSLIIYVLFPGARVRQYLHSLSKH